MSHETERQYNVLMSEISLWVGENFELMEMLLKSLTTQLSLNALCSVLYFGAMVVREDM